MEKRDSLKRLGIIAVLEHQPWGGSEELWTQAASVLLQKGIQVDVITRDWNTPVEVHQTLEKQGATFFRHRPEFAGRWFVRTLTQKGFSLPWTREASVAWMKQRSPDMVLVSQTCNWDGLDWMMRLKKAGIPYASLSHAASEFFSPDDSQREPLRSVLQASQANFYVSEANRRLTELQIAMDIPRASLVRNPIKVNRSQGVAWPEKESPLVLGCPARYDLQDKGQDLLLQVLAQKKWKERALEVRFYGAGKNEKNLRDLIEYLGVPQAKVIGYEGDLKKIWNSSHALVMTSRVEGLPISIVEAMISGRACAVTRAGGNAELIEEGQEGWIAEFPEVGEIDRMLEKLWSQRDQCQAMGERARQRALQMIPENPAETFAESLQGVVTR
ncbi:MAG: glycosyltransferase family 4 protein [Verrucomicrobiota bacterium]